jgi:hypothetical protein
MSLAGSSRHWLPKSNALMRTPNTVEYRRPYDKDFHSA